MNDLNGTIRRIFGEKVTVERRTPVSGGDINRDGNVSVADAVMLCKYLTGNEQLNGEQAKQADLDDNQLINAIDLTLLKQMLLRQ